MLGRTLASHVSCSFFDELDPHDHRLSGGCGRDSPQFAATTDRVADGRRRVLPRGIDLEVAVRVDDFETPAGHECRMPSRANPKPASPARLREPLALAPLMLLQQHDAELGVACSASKATTILGRVLESGVVQPPCEVEQAVLATGRLRA
jgi:hypothetical protein